MTCYMCNILRNNAKTIFNTVKYLKIFNSCILENNCTQLVYQSGSNYVYFYNCTCQNVTSNAQSSIRTYDVPSSSFLHALDCFQTGHCIAAYDYLDGLDPYIPNENKRSTEAISNKNLKRKALYI